MIRHGASAVGESRRAALSCTESPGNATKKGMREDADADDLVAQPHVDADALWVEMGLDRRSQDIQLRDQLAAEGFDGLALKRFAEELAAYGLAVMFGWMRSGHIWTKCAQKKIRLQPPGHWNEQDWEDLASGTVYKALIKFRDNALIDGKWDPTGGASLKTFFIGRCIYSFANTYRSWLALQGHPALTTSDGLDELERRPDSRGAYNPEARVLSDFEIADALDQLDPLTRAAVKLHADGYSQEEIAELLGKSPGSIRGVLTRQRKRGRTRRGTDGRGSND